MTQAAVHFEDEDSESDHEEEFEHVVAKKVGLSRATIDALAKAKRLASPMKRRRGRRWVASLYGKRHGAVYESNILADYHRTKLRTLLGVLIRQHQWTQAAGVVSVLLGSLNPDSRHRGVPGIQSDFWAALEVLRQVGGSQGNTLRFRRLYRILSRKQPNATCRGEVQLDLALFLMNQGDHDGAHNELRPIVDVSPFRDDPLVKLCYGLNLHCLWHEKVIQELPAQEKDAIEPLLAQDREFTLFEGTGENEEMEHGSLDPSSEREGPEWSGLKEDGSPSKELFQHTTYEDGGKQKLADDSNEFWQSATVISSPDLDRRLFPVRILHLSKQKKQYVVPMNSERSRELHSGAVKHLKQTLAGTPDMIPALLPLVQLLLAVGDVKGANDVIDNCCHASDHIAPFCMKVLLLESLDQKEPVLLACGYQNVLKRNPSAVSYLQALSKLHSAGNCKSRLFLECMVLHLDVEQGDLKTWKDLVQFFHEMLNLSPNENIISGNSQIVVYSGGQPNCGSSSQAEGHGMSRSFMFGIWQPRHKCWLDKHFIYSDLEREQQQTGSWRRIVYKAVCAAHIYGPNVGYAQRVLTVLRSKEQTGLLGFLQHHCDRSIKIL